MDKGLHPPFSKKNDLRIAKNYCTSVVVKINNALLFNRIEREIEKILRRNVYGFRKNRSTTSQLLTIRRILKGVRAKKSLSDTIICRFLPGIWHYTQTEDRANTSGLRSPKETVAAIIRLDKKNTKVKVHSPDRETHFFDTVASVLLGDT